MRARGLRLGQQLRPGGEEHLAGAGDWEVAGDPGLSWLGLEREGKGVWGLEVKEDGDIEGPVRVRGSRISTE